MKLGAVLRRWRTMEELSVRDAAQLMKISAATLSRIESGESMDGKTLASILVWLMRDDA